MDRTRRPGRIFPKILPAEKFSQKFFAAALLAGFCAGVAGPGAAATRALLVGAADYRHIDADLKGPANDVALMARALAARGADRIVRLIDDGDGADGPATRAAILEALAALAADTGPGDTAVFYFSGHGSQAPDESGDENGGPDEILLPVDVRGWDGRARQVENAILDDEMRAVFASILARGGAVVAILDACHSATGFRAMGAGQPRAVAPVLLGLPEDVGTPGAAVDDGGLTGDYAFLYSSRADERSFEYAFGDPSDPASWHGAFTAALAGVLEQGGGLSWGQAAEAATAAMRAAHPQATQSPDAEGTALDWPIGGGEAAAERRFRVTGAALEAGRLSGLAPGARLVVYDLATGTEVLGEAEVTAVEATRATLAPGAPAEGWAVVRVPGPPEPFRLGPVQVVSGDPGTVLSALDGLTLPGVVTDSARPDAVPLVVDGQLVLAGPDGALDPGGPGTSPRAGDDVAQFVERAARTHRLRVALAQAGGGGGFKLPGSGLKVTSEIEKAADGCDVHAAAAPLPDRAAVAACDRIWMTLRNPSKEPRDVTVLYFDAAFGVQAIWPAPGESNRLGFTEEIEVGLEIRAEGQTGGREDIVILSVPAEEGRPRTVLTALADVEATRAAPPGDDLSRWLYAATDPEATARVLNLKGTMPSLDIIRIGLTLVPGTPPEGR